MSALPGKTGIILFNFIFDDGKRIALVCMNFGGCRVGARRSRGSADGLDGLDGRDAD